MAEHEVTEAMVEAVRSTDNPIEQMLMVLSVAREHDQLISRTWVQAWAEKWQKEREAALAARTTPQPTDASAASGHPSLMRWVANDDANYATGWLPWRADLAVPIDGMWIEYAYAHPTGAGADADARGSCSQTPDGECVYRKTQRFLGDPRESVSVGCNDDVGTNASSPQQRAGDGG